MLTCKDFLKLIEGALAIFQFCICMFSHWIVSTLCDPMDCSMPGFPVLHSLSEFAQIHVHWLGDAIQPSRPLSTPSPSALSVSPGIRVSSSEPGLHFRWAKYGASASASILPANIQGWFPLGLTGLISSLSKGLSRVFSSTTIQKHQFFSTQPSLWCHSHICT